MTFMFSSKRWEHGESTPSPTIATALHVSLDGTWDTLPHPASDRHFRALMIASLAAARLNYLPPPKTSQGYPAYGDLNGADYADDERRGIATALSRTWLLFVTPEIVDGKPMIPIQSIKTTEGGPAEPINDNTEEPITICTVLVVCAAAAAVCWIAGKVAEVIDRDMMREEETKKLLATQANSITLVQSHNDQERKVGKRIEYTKQELQLFQNLLDQQTELSRKKEIPLGDPFDGAIASIKGAVSTVGEGVSSAASSVASYLLPAAAVGLIAVLLLQSSKESAPAPAPPPRRADEDPEIGDFRHLEPQAIVVQAETT